LLLIAHSSGLKGLLSFLDILYASPGAIDLGQEKVIENRKLAQMLDEKGTTQLIQQANKFIEIHIMTLE
jgi:hypothetical protein